MTGLGTVPSPHFARPAASSNELSSAATPCPQRGPARWAWPVAATAVCALAVAAIVFQQLHRTPWGLPGHRGVFWLTSLIIARLAVRRHGTAVVVAAASSSVLLTVDASLGQHVVPYLLAGLLIDAALAVPLIARHPWMLAVLAPVIHLVGVFSPFVHNLQFASLGTVLSGMSFYIRGHLMWGLAAGILGTTIGLLGGRGLDRLRPPPPNPAGASSGPADA